MAFAHLMIRSQVQKVEAMSPSVSPPPYPGPIHFPLLLKRWSPIIYLKLIKKSTHSTARAKARDMLRVDTERRFLPRFKNQGLAPSNVSTYIFTSFSYTHRASGQSFQRFWSISPSPLRLTTSVSLPHCPNGFR